jgi:hypothetical protein
VFEFVAIKNYVENACITKSHSQRKVHIKFGECLLDDQGFESWQGLGIFLFTTMSRPTLGPTQPPVC